MELRHLLLAFIVLNHTLTTVMWWVGGTWMGLSRKAARQWMVASLANGVALALTVISAKPDDDLTLIGCALATVGAVSLRRGLQAFVRIPGNEWAHTGTLVGVIGFDMAVALPMGWSNIGVLLSCGAITMVLIQTLIENYAPIKAEFSEKAAWVHTATLGTATLLVALVGCTVALQRWHLPWLNLSPDVTRFVLVFSTLSLSISCSFVLGYIVVMRLVRRLEHLSHHDALTGLLNRRAIEYLLDREDQRLQRFHDPYSVLLVDIDHFKRINDRIGHAAGDTVLVAVARTLQAQAREVDRVARYGGEEFCVLLPHTLHEGAEQAAERLREAVAKISVPWDDEVITVSISVGLACADSPGEPLQSLLRRTDEALYRAKAEGRNRVVRANPATLGRAARQA